SWHRCSAAVTRTAVACSTLSRSNGTTCNDGNASTVGDVCTAGVCAGVDHCAGVTCTASDQCHVAGTCVDHATGACSNQTAPNGTPYEHAYAHPLAYVLARGRRLG